MCVCVCVCGGMAVILITLSVETPDNLWFRLFSCGRKQSFSSMFGIGWYVYSWKFYAGPFLSLSLSLSLSFLSLPLSFFLCSLSLSFSVSISLSLSFFSFFPLSFFLCSISLSFSVSLYLSFSLFLPPSFSLKWSIRFIKSKSSRIWVVSVRFPEGNIHTHAFFFFTYYKICLLSSTQLCWWPYIAYFNIYIYTLPHGGWTLWLKKFTAATSNELGTLVSGKAKM